jgi:hypothetical protein
MRLVVCDTGSKADILVKAAVRMPTLKVVIVIKSNTLSQEVIHAGQKAGVDVHSFADVLVIC